MKRLVRLELMKLLRLPQIGGIAARARRRVKACTRDGNSWLLRKVMDQRTDLDDSVGHQVVFVSHGLLVLADALVEHLLFASVHLFLSLHLSLLCSHLFL